MSNSALPRKRDRFFGRFKKDGGPPPSSAATPPGAAPANGPANTTSSPAAPQPNVFQPYDVFLAAALEKLDDRDRSVIEGHYVASHINETVQAAYDGANELKTKIEDTKGPVRAKVDNVLVLIDKFKAIGDGLASLDPIHAGLPWAGVKVLLSVAVADIKQREALVTGMDLALGISNRLRAYFLFFQPLPAHLTTDNFRKALVEVYAKILQFLAQAFKIYKTNPVLRGARTLWQDATLQDFEKVCDRHSHRLEIEALNCDRYLRETGRIEAAQWRDNLMAELKQLDDLSNIDHRLQNLSINVDLSKLVVVASATFNSSEESQQPSCLPGTRVDILNQILIWVKDPDGKSIYWLCGGAGTGKSTISRTVAQMLQDEKLLGASFFFKRSHAGRGNADLFFPTIVRQLADQIQALKQPIADALNENSLLPSNGLEDHFNKLLKAPLMSLEQKSLPQKRFVIVIDALDECDRKHIKKFLTLLASINTIDKLQLRIFVTSRPELPIEINFGRIDGRLHDDYVLETVQKVSIDDDLRKYLVHEFTEIRKEWPYSPLPEDWPSQEQIVALVALANPLFIYAATVCRFVGEGAPQKRLNGILTNKHVVSSVRLGKETAHLQLIYSQVLLEAMRSDDVDELADKTAAFKQVVGTILLSADPLSVKSLSNILAMDEDDINTVLRPLRSVLDVPRDLTQPVQRRHLSFREYLLDPKDRTNKAFRIEEKQTHARLATRCMRLLMDSNALKQDICGVRKPGFKRIALSESDIAQKISCDIAYACMYWVYHLVASGGPSKQDAESDKLLMHHDDVYEFLTKHFLHWLETMAWLGRYTLAISSIVDLIGVLKISGNAIASSTRLRAGETQECAEYILLLFLEDARRFTLKFRHVIDATPLQIYHSAIMFTPTRSVISATFRAGTPDLWALFPHVPPRWSDEFLVLEGNVGCADHMTFSPDGKILASTSSEGYNDTTTQLWSITGELLNALRFDQRVIAVSFVGGGEILASATENGHVQFWMVDSGDCLRDFWILDYVPRRYELSIVLGPRIIWTTRNDQLWSCDQEGQQRQLFWALNKASGTFSERRADNNDIDGQVNASDSRHGNLSAIENPTSSGDETEAETECLPRSVEHNKCLSPDAPERKFTGVTISSVGMIAARTNHGELFVWKSGLDMEPSIMDHRLGGGINAISFSAHGDFATSGGDGTLRFWTWSENQAVMKWEVKAREGYAGSMAFISDDLLAHSSDYKVIVRHTRTGKVLQELCGHTFFIRSVAVSSDGQLASGAADYTIRLWKNISSDQTSVNVPEVAYDQVETMIITPREHMIATGHKGEVRTWDTRSGNELKIFQGQEREQCTVVISPDAKTIAAVSKSGKVEFWDVDTEEKQQSVINDAGYEIYKGAFSPNSKTFVFESTAFLEEGLERSLLVWDLERDEEVRRYSWQEHTTVTSLAFSPDGEFLSSAHACGRVYIWSTCQSSVVLLPFDCDRDMNIAVAVSNRKVIATARIWSWPVRLWNIDSGELLCEIFADDGAPAPQQLEFSLDGNHLRTTAGSFALSDQAQPTTRSLIYKPHRLRLNEAGDWIQQDSEDMIWLPLEFRATRRIWDTSPVISGETLAIGTSAQGVAWFRLKEHVSST